MLELPLFPLNLILLPYEYLPLHIFEPRYKKMIKNAIDNNAPFGIILSQGDGVFSKGVKVCVTEVFKEYNNGEYDILVKGQELFEVMGTEMDGDTVIGKIEYVPIEASSEDLHFQKFQDSYLKVLMKFGKQIKTTILYFTITLLKWTIPILLLFGIIYLSLYMVSLLS